MGTGRQGAPHAGGLRDPAGVRLLLTWRVLPIGGEVSADALVGGAMMSLTSSRMPFMLRRLRSSAVFLLAAWTFHGMSNSMAASVDGERVYRATCSTCHDSGAGAAPVTGRLDDWKERFAYGRSALQRAAIEGVSGTAMAAKGGFDRLGAEEVAAAVDYMLQRTGFEEPAVVKPRPVPAVRPVASGIVPDAVVTARVAAALRAHMTSGNPPIDVEGADLVVRGVGIRVDTSAGTVRLMGVVQDAVVVKRAESVVRSVEGVRGVDNRLVSGGMLDFD